MAFATVNEYVDSLGEKGKMAVCDFVDFMKAEFPEVTPKICFAIPMWWAGIKMYNGYVAISAAKAHYSIHFHDEEHIKRLSKILPDCALGKRCISIRYDDEKSNIVLKQKVNEYFTSLLG